jgi:hypothetical protein
MEAGADKQELQLAEGKYALLSLRVTFGHAMPNRDYVLDLKTVYPPWPSRKREGFILDFELYYSSEKRKNKSAPANRNSIGGGRF